MHELKGKRTRTPPPRELIPKEYCEVLENSVSSFGGLFRRVYGPLIPNGRPSKHSIIQAIPIVKALISAGAKGAVINSNKSESGARMFYWLVKA